MRPRVGHAEHTIHPVQCVVCSRACCSKRRQILHPFPIAHSRQFLVTSIAPLEPMCQPETWAQRARSAAAGGGGVEGFSPGRPEPSRSSPLRPIPELRMKVTVVGGLASTSVPLTHMQRTLQPLRPEDLMKSDLLSEILLVGSGMAVGVAFVMVVIAMFVSWLVQS